VRRHTGFAIGGVAPVGHGLSKVFVEKALAAHNELWAAAGHPHTVFRLSYPQLLSITGGSEAELAA
jgi:prolyl-tRNA editing enzyme YbaK/EbsC (Cys-tRNA(Pro) deacylase)